MTSSSPILVTERLLLRSFEASDLPIYAAVNSDREVMRYLGGAVSLKATEGQMRGATRSFETSGYGKLAIERRSDGTFLGICGLSREQWYPDDLELGWRLAREHWGEGYATEAATAWLGHAFETLGAPKVISIADLPNLRSIAVMQRLGMALHHEAELEDNGESFRAVVYSISADRYRQNRQ